MNVVDLMLRAKQLAALVDFQDYEFSIECPHGEVFVQGHYVEPDTYTQIPQPQSTRKWLLSPAMSDSEIVQTFFKLCLQSSEHRAREAFRYKRARIFGPHYDIEELVQLCDFGRERAGGRA